MNKEKEEVEIDLLELGKKLWDNKKFIIKCSIIGAVVGLVVAFSIPKEYTTTVILTTESGKSAGGSMGALASMAGLNLGGLANEDTFSPELYPNVLNSTPFIQSLLKINVVDENQNLNTTLFHYLKNEQKSAWWSYIIKAPFALINAITPEGDVTNKTNNTRFITKEEIDVIDIARNAYFINTDKKTGITTIEATAQSPLISAFLADTITSYLQVYIIEQRTRKAKTDLSNSEKLYTQAKEEYYKSQEKLATFADGNMNVISAKYNINQEKLQNEVNITYSVYTQMAQQVQMNKIKVQDNTPVFTIIQPAIEPLEPSKPKKKLIVLALTFLSAIIACGYTMKEELIQKMSRN